MRHVEIITTAAALVFLAAPTMAKDKDKGRTARAENAAIAARERLYRAELRADANAPGPSHSEMARIRATLAAREGRAERKNQPSIAFGGTPRNPSPPSSGEDPTVTRITRDDPAASSNRRMALEEDFDQLDKRFDNPVTKDEPEKSDFHLESKPLPNDYLSPWQPGYLFGPGYVPGYYGYGPGYLPRSYDGRRSYRWGR